MLSEFCSECLGPCKGESFDAEGYEGQRLSAYWSSCCHAEVIGKEEQQRTLKENLLASVVEPVRPYDPTEIPF